MDNSNDYVVRIASATPAELVVVTYEMLSDSLSEAISAQTDEAFDTAAKRAKALLDELILSLNFEYEISYELLSIYFYINKLMMAAFQKRTENKDVEPLEEASRIVNELLKSWRVVAEEDRLNGGESVINAGKVYSGLTYDKDGQLVETEVNDNVRSYDA
jgi:flagellar protein FliS